MRLIDADKLLEVLNKKSVPFNANVNDAILTAPTVDAVPGEWIKQWSKKPVTEKDMKLAEQCEWNILEWLIADWQKGKKND